MGQILRVTKAFSVLSDPSGHVYVPGELVDADHPHVKGREGNFETVEAHVSARSGVEQASAAPGEKRSRGRVRKPAAKKTTAKNPAFAPIVVESDTAGTGAATNAETGEVTKAGEPLPEIKSED